MPRSFLLFAAFFGFTAVALGAFAAHGLKSRLPTEMLVVFQTGVQYQMLHALALLMLALLARHTGGLALLAAGALFVLGIVLFSGSLYWLALTGTRSPAMITPIGGLSFLAGWFCLGIVGWRFV
ncbi:hypothetical protein AXE65_11570 [Ventosimonas gracilis]|uniref:DUF423 domain-containing protein n=1 Tax=Ventosimonas gracilis TaxID=1680762 RepID=A0A139SWA1_9GAMM|nr:DUF423 domain-containing protein [Ventosimonas gracilis]KXU38873.1 hypothetical protein AXE65_11570 [Ventosimonas gracilis]